MIYILEAIDKALDKKVLYYNTDLYFTLVLVLVLAYRFNYKLVWRYF
jgi:hypothetical protein